MPIDIDHYQDSGPVLLGRGTATTAIDNVGWCAASVAENLTYPLYPIIRPGESDPLFSYSYDYYTFFKLSGTYNLASRPRIKIALAGVTETMSYSFVGPGSHTFAQVVTVDSVVKDTTTLVEGVDYNTEKITVGDDEVSKINFVTSTALSGPAVLTVTFSYPGVLPIDQGVRVFFQLTDTYDTPTAQHEDGLIFFNNEPIVIYPRISTVGPNTGLGYLKFLEPNTTYYTEYLRLRIYIEQINADTLKYEISNVGPLSFTCYIDEYESDDI